MDPFTIGALAITASSNALAKDRESRVRRMRIELMKKLFEEDRKKRLSEGTQQINQYTQGLRQNEFARAQRRAVAMGRENQAEAFALPGTQQVARAGSDALSRYLTDTNRSFDAQKLAIERDEAAEPIPAGAFDYISSISGSVSDYLSNKEAMVPAETELSRREAQATPGFTDDVVSGLGVQKPLIAPYVGPVYEPGAQNNFLSDRRNDAILGSDWFKGLRKRGRRRYALED